MNAYTLGDTVLYKAGKRTRRMRGIVTELDLWKADTVTIKKRKRTAEVSVNDIIEKVEPKTQATNSAVDTNEGRAEAKRKSLKPGDTLYHPSLGKVQVIANTQEGKCVYTFDQDSAAQHVDGKADGGIQPGSSGVEERAELRGERNDGPGNGSPDLPEEASRLRGQSPSQGPGTILDGEGHMDASLSPSAHLDRRKQGQGIRVGLAPEAIGEAICPHCRKTFALIPPRSTEEAQARSDNAQSTSPNESS